MLYTRPVESFVNGLIPVFIAATTLVLGIGIVAMFVGGRFNRSYSNRLMRWRVLLQFLAVCLIAASSYFFAK
jgi:hypothetical protein